MRVGWQGILLLLTLLSLPTILAAGEVSHPAEQIKPGTFGGAFGGGAIHFS